MRAGLFSPFDIKQAGLGIVSQSFPDADGQVDVSFVTIIAHVLQLPSPPTP